MVASDRDGKEDVMNTKTNTDMIGLRELSDTRTYDSENRELSDSDLEVVVGGAVSGMNYALSNFLTEGK
jgi:hypothetical protein